MSAVIDLVSDGEEAKAATAVIDPSCFIFDPAAACRIPSNRAYSCDMNGNIWSHKSNLRLKWMKQRQRKTGYFRWNVYLWHQGVKKTHMVHQLVGDCFLEHEEGKPDVDHIDPKRTDDPRLCNLRRATRSENLWNNSGWEEKKKSKLPKNVYYDDRSECYYVQIMKHYKKYTYWSWESPEAAEVVAKEKRRLLHGEFANDGY